MWETVKLGDLCEVVTKGTTPTSVGFKFESEGINFVKVESLAADSTFINSKFAKVNSECHEALKRSQLKEGDILFSIAGALGRTAIVTEDILPANTNQALAIVRLKENVEVDKRFLLYVLNSQSTKEQSDLNKGGVAQQNLSLTQLKNYAISLPPLAEQQRIVAKLDAAFAEIDRAIEGATSRESALGALKEAAIDSHFQSLKNEKRMGDVFEFVRGPFGGSLKKNMFVTEGFAVYEQQHAIRDQCNEFRYYVPQKKFDEMSRFRVSPNAILMSCSGTIGKTTIIPSNFIEGIINQALLMLKPSNEVVPKFATLYMNSKRFSQQLMERVEGAAQKNVASVKVLKEILIPLPKIEEQQQLVSDIEKVFSEIGIAQIITESTIENYIQLKSAILAQELQPPQSQAA